MPPELTDYLRASDGNGESVRLIVVEPRGVGDLVFNNTTPTNWHNYFIAMAGTVDPTTDRFIEGEYVVFKGHLDGSAITIDELAPGYVDNGNQEDDIIVIKPTTLWADIVADTMDTVTQAIIDAEAATVSANAAASAATTATGLANTATTNANAATTNANNAANATSWTQGTAVPTGGYDGNFYLRTTTYDVYQKIAGTWTIVANIKGATGATGSTGAAGTPGSQLRSGTGVPSNGTGIDGDYYLRTSTGDLYLRSGGTYSIIMNINSNSSLVFNETLGGTPNGVLTTFTTVSTAANLIISKNGLILKPTTDYSYNQGTKTVTFVVAPATSSVLLATYTTTNTTMVIGSNSFVQNETPVGTINGVTTLFTLARGYNAGSVELFINGIRQINGTHFTETSPSGGTITISDAPITGDNLSVSYQFASSVSSNSDTVDGYHANATPTAGNIPVLDSNGKMLPATLGGVAFRARRTTTLTTPANGQTTNFVFNTADYNYSSAYSTSTGLFTAPFNGVYQFDGSFDVEGTVMARAFIVPRGTATTLPRPVDMTVGTGGNQSRVNWVMELYMAAGQTFGVDVWTSGATDVGRGTTETWLAGHLVMATP